MEDVVLIPFVRRIMKCKGKHVFVDGGYLASMGSAKIWFKLYRNFGPRSASFLNWRIRRFWELFPSKATLKGVEKWTKAFSGFVTLSKRCLS